MVLTGCQEFVHMGQISDRDSSRSIGSASIEQKQSDGSWKLLDQTDGNGRWWIMKSEVGGGGRIRISKPGYYPKVIPENEFMQEHSLLLVPSGAGGFGDDAEGMWQSCLPPRHRRCLA
jgi:hypothetical protein